MFVNFCHIYTSLIFPQVTILEDVNKPDRKVCVANTHLYWHPKGKKVTHIGHQVVICDLRQTFKKYPSFTLKGETFAWSRWAWLCSTWVTWSARSHLEPLWSFVVTSTPHPAQVTPQPCPTNRNNIVVKCLNVLCLCPPAASGVFQLVSEAGVPQQHEDWSSSGPEEACSMELPSTFPPLLSACSQPAYTNYVGGFHGCLDYIFIQPDSMQVMTLRVGRLFHPLVVQGVIAGRLLR